MIRILNVLRCTADGSEWNGQKFHGEKLGFGFEEQKREFFPFASSDDVFVGNKNFLMLRFETSIN